MASMTIGSTSRRVRPPRFVTGDAVVAVGAWRLSDGQPVRVIEEDAQP